MREDVRITHLESITNGWESDIYVLTIAYTQVTRRTREDAILKLYYGESGLQRAQLS